MWRLKCIFRCKDLLRTAVLLLLSRGSAHKQHNNFRSFSVLTYIYIYQWKWSPLENTWSRSTGHSSTLCSTIQAHCYTCNWQQTFSKTKSPFLPIDTHTATMSLLSARYSNCFDVCLMCVNTSFAYISCRQLPYCLTCSYNIIHRQSRITPSPHSSELFDVRMPNPRLQLFPVCTFHFHFSLTLLSTSDAPSSCHSVRVCSALCTGVPLLTS